MDQLGAIVSHTPAWVFVLFAVLVIVGVQSARPRRVALARLMIVPAVFIVWGLVSLVTRPNLSAALLGDWMVAALAGGMLAMLTVRLQALRVDRARRMVETPGSWLPLARIVAIFLAKYAFGVAMAIAPEDAGRLAFWDIAVSGLAAGYFLGWLVRFARAYRRAPALAASNVAIAGQAP